MGAPYTRQTSFSNGDVVDAGLFNAEFDQLVAVFDETTGHSHDGTAGEGARLAASVITFDNTASGLVAADLQAAVDEIEARLEVEENLTNTGPVLSVNGNTGIVVLTGADFSLGNVDNTSDADKPVSTATQAALDLKADAAATQASLDLKLPINGGIPEVSSVRQAADVSLGTGTHTFAYANADMQQLTATGDITVAFSGFPSGSVSAFIVDAVNWGAHVITLPVGILMASGTPPTFTAAGTDRLLFLNDKDDVLTLHVVTQELSA